jgi:hypothetical protein
VQVDSFSKAMQRGGSGGGGSGKFTNLFKSKLLAKGNYAQSPSAGSLNAAAGSPQQDGAAAPGASPLARPGLSPDEMLTWSNVSGTPARNAAQRPPALHASNTTPAMRPAPTDPLTCTLPPPICVMAGVHPHVPAQAAIGAADPGGQDLFRHPAILRRRW